MRDLLDEEGENRALRTFLMQYGLPGLTVGAMEKHMRRSGWGDECVPAFAISPVAAGMHLTKAGAQIWIRHLLSLERTPSPASTAGGARQSIADVPEFQDLLSAFGYNWTEGDEKQAASRDALIAHIDTWAGRSAGERERELCAKMGAMQAQIDQLTAERSAGEVVPAGDVKVPVAAYLWLMGMGNEGFIEDRNGAFWWRGAFNDRAGLDMMAIYAASRGAAPAPGNTAQPDKDG